MHDFDVITGPTPAQRLSVCPVMPTPPAPRPSASEEGAERRLRDEAPSTEAARRSPV